MGSRRLNSRLVKLHRTYTVEEVSTLFGIHRNTVRQWIKRGLATNDCRRPTLILGHVLAAFVQAKRTRNTKPCQPGEIYCVRCRHPKNPAGDMAEYQPVTKSLGNIIGICPSCETMMYRRVNLRKMEQVRGRLDITMPEASPHIGESNQPSVNSDLAQEV